MDRNKYLESLVDETIDKLYEVEDIYYVDEDSPRPRPYFKVWVGEDLEVTINERAAKVSTCRHQRVAEALTPLLKSIDFNDVLREYEDACMTETERVFGSEAGYWRYKFNK